MKPKQSKKVVQERKGSEAKSSSSGKKPNKKVTLDSLESSNDML